MQVLILPNMIRYYFILFSKNISTFGYKQVVKLENLFKSFNIMVISNILLNIYIKFGPKNFFSKFFLMLFAPLNWQNLAIKRNIN